MYVCLKTRNLFMFVCLFIIIQEGTAKYVIPMNGTIGRKNRSKKDRIQQKVDFFFFFRDKRK